MPYQLTIKPRAIKALEKINDPAYSHIKDAILDLANNPRPHGYKKLKGREGYRIRVGDYRILIIFLTTYYLLMLSTSDIGKRFMSKDYFISFKSLGLHHVPKFLSS